MAENVIWTRKIGEGILMDQNEKEKGNKNRERFLDG
jgi:hypothetical protein